MSDQQQPPEPDFVFDTETPPANWPGGPKLYQRFRAALAEGAEGKQAKATLATVQTELQTVRGEVEQLKPKATALEQVARERDQMAVQLAGLRAGIADPEVLDVAAYQHRRWNEAQPEASRKPFGDWLAAEGRQSKALAPHFVQQQQTQPPAATPPATPAATPPARPPNPAPVVAVDTAPPATPPAKQLSAEEVETIRRQNNGRLPPDVQKRVSWELAHPGKAYPGPQHTGGNATT